MSDFEKKYQCKSAKKPKRIIKNNQNIIIECKMMLSKATNMYSKINYCISRYVQTDVPILIVENLRF